MRHDVALHECCDAREEQRPSDDHRSRESVLDLGCCLTRMRSPAVADCSLRRRSSTTEYLSYGVQRNVRIECAAQVQ